MSLNAVMQFDSVLDTLQLWMPAGNIRLRVCVCVCVCVHACVCVCMCASVWLGLHTLYHFLFSKKKKKNIIQKLCNVEQ